MHRLLERQIGDAAIGPDGALDVSRLLVLVDAAYEDADRNRRAQDRALAALQGEMDLLNRMSRDDDDARFNAVMDYVGEAIIIVDERGMIESFNHAAEKMFGFPAEEVIGGNLTLLMLHDTDIRRNGALARFMPTETEAPDGDASGRETVGRRRDGSEFPIELTIGQIMTGQIRRFVGVVRDISRRKQAERDLRESESRFRDIAGSASDWFWETGPDHRLAFVSERIGAVLGVKPAAILGTTFFELGLDDNPTVAAQLREDILALRPFRDRSFHVGPPQGSDSRIIRISGIPIFTPDGEFIGYRGVGVDITREAAAERRAQMARQQLADAIESIVDGIVVFDAQDRMVICNREYVRVFGKIVPALAPGQGFRDILRANQAVFDTEGVPFAQWERWRTDLHRHASGQPFSVRMADGRWILHREYRMADGGVVGVRTDITEIKRREEELDQLRRRYKLILDSAGEGILGLDGQCVVTFANRMAGQILGQEPDRLVGRNFHALAQPRDAEGGPLAPEDTAVWAACREGAVRQVGNDVFWLDQDRALPVDYFAAPIVEDNAVAGAVLVFRDATLRMQYERTLAENQRNLERLVSERTMELQHQIEVRARTEAALRDSRERLKGITDRLFEGVVVVNRGGHLVFANPSARRLLVGDSISGDLEGYPLDEVLRLVAADGTETNFVGSPWQWVAVHGGMMRDDDAIFVVADGRKLAVAYACSPLGGENGSTGAVISFRDMEALKEAQREALQASRMASVGQLAAGIAHEINTPIQYIGDNLRFIRDSFADIATAVAAARDLSAQVAATGQSEAVGAFEHALESADVPYLVDEIPRAVDQSLEGVAQVARIVLSMKEFSHPGSSEKSMANINRALENTLMVSRNTWKHVADIEEDFDADLPMVPCHAGELNQVFLNLIVNAAQAIETASRGGKGHIRISTRCEGDSVVVRVSDDGTGIQAAIRDRIFDPFFTTKAVGKGTGQGLAICRDVVVAKHGGRIDVESEDGKGSTFIVRLPLASGDQEARDMLESA